MADPSANLRVITVDPEAAGFFGSKVFSTSPFNGGVSPISEDGDMPSAGDDIVAFDGDVYAADFTKIIRLNLNGTAQPDGGFGNHIEDITADIFFPGFVVSLTVNSTGILYVADSENNIYTVDPSGAPTAVKTPVSISQGFDKIVDIYIDGGFLYILDTKAGGDDDDGPSGEIYKVDLSDLTVTTAYSGITGDESLKDATAIAVKNDEIFVAGSSFSFDTGILKITSSGTQEFFDNLPSSFTLPKDIVIDENGNDLYVTAGSSIYRFNLLTPPPPNNIPKISNAQFSLPVGLTTLTITGQIAELELSLEKTVNATQALPGQGLLYTITATNEGPESATAVFLHDFFPAGVESVEISAGQLSFTSEVHDVSEDTVIEAGNCERGASAFVVDCDGFGTLDEGDFIVVTLEGKIIPGAGIELTNLAVVENIGKSAQNTTTTTLVSELSLVKNASPTSVIAGEGFIDYTIRVENQNAISAEDVIITDTLPNDVSDLTINSQPISNLCSITPDIDETTILQCGPYIIANNGVVEIKYRVAIDVDAGDSIKNTVELTCSNCASSQTSTSTDIIRHSDLFIDKTSETDSVVPGQDSILYTLSIGNDGPSDADAVVVTDELPDGVTFVEANSAECSYDSQNHAVICALTTPLLAGEERTLTISVSVNPDATGELINTANITSSSTDNDEENNAIASEPIPVEANTDVSLIKTATNAVAGGKILYNLTVSNSGPSAALGVFVQDFLPPSLTFIEHTQLGSLTDPDCANVLGTIVCDFGNMGAGVTQTKSIQAQIPLTATGTVINEAEVFSDIDSDPDNNASTLSTTIEPPFCGRAEDDYDSIIFGTENNDNIKGTNGDDLIFGLGGKDKIQGKDGDDCIFGGDGDDKIHGGKGNDTIEGNDGDDQIHGQQGDDTLIGGDGDDKIHGGKGNDTIDGGAGDNTIHGNQGNDNITSGSGDDKIHGGEDNDTINAGAGNNKIHGNQGDDNIVAGDGDDKIHGGKGNDTIIAGNGKNDIHGHQGNDIITSGDGDDKIHGGQGNDTIDAGSGDNKIHGHQGDDNIISGTGDDRIHAGAGTDQVNAGGGNDKIFGAQGHDQLFGEEGDDIIHGGQGDDFIDGGEDLDGEDIDKCNGAQGKNTIVNCEVEDKKMKEDKEDDEEEDEDDDDDDEDEEDDDDDEDEDDDD